MKYISEYREKGRIASLLKAIQHAAEPDKHYRFMEFCGGHTHALFRYGLIDLLPASITMLHGPGCPVCVLPISRIDAAIELASRPETVLCSYGDMLRVPGSNRRSLLRAKAEGADVRMVYSPAEVLEFARQEPERQFIFFAVGFETTTPPTAAILHQCIAQQRTNIRIFCNHVLTPPAVQGILEPQRANKTQLIDGLVGPGHVSLITGTQSYQEIAEHYGVPIVVSGFEPVDLLQSVLMLVEQVNSGKHEIVNQYSRAVTTEGNKKARALIDTYFELRPSFEWRGLGVLPDSALQLRPAFRHYDAETLLENDVPVGTDNKACECPAVLTGQKSPTECKLYGNPCTPDNPLGACMVSSEGACSAYYQYRGKARSA